VRLLPEQSANHGHPPEHFRWDEGGRLIRGRTAIGRATEAALRLNRAELVEARGFWIEAGWHPPADDSAASGAHA